MPQLQGELQIMELPEEHKEKSVPEDLAYINQHFDPDYAVALLEKVGLFCMDNYFRSRFIGFDEEPQRNNKQVPLVYISNHSGMAFPWDGMNFGAKQNMPHGFKAGALRTLVSPELSETRLMNPYLVKNFWKRIGGVDATFRNFEALMQQSDYNVLIYPEGIPGIGKGFNRKYELQKFHTSYLRLALKYDTTLQWVSTVNGEYVNPYSYSFEAINKYSKQAGIPFLPITALLVGVILQPWLFYFSFPARLTFVKGPRIRPSEWIDKPYEDLTDDTIRELSGRIKDMAQSHLLEAEKEYGNKPFDWKSLRTALWQNKRYFPFYLPVFWPLVFSEFERKYTKNGERDFEVEFGFVGLLKMFWNNPLCLAYFIPVLGWLPLLIIGYKDHNISANERRRNQRKK